jgi:hypothetical protein
VAPCGDEPARRCSGQAFQNGCVGSGGEPLADHRPRLSVANENVHSFQTSVAMSAVKVGLELPL